MNKKQIAFLYKKASEKRLFLESQIDQILNRRSKIDRVSIEKLEQEKRLAIAICESIVGDTSSVWYYDILPALPEKLQKKYASLATAKYDDERLELTISVKKAENDPHFDAYMRLLQDLFQNKPYGLNSTIRFIVNS